MKKGLSNEAKTGIMVVVCVLLLLGLVVKVGKLRLLEKGYDVKVVFDYVSGVEKGAPVRISGVEAGEIKGVRLICGDKTQVELTLHLNSGARIRSDSKICVTTLGMMGEKYVEITGGAQGADFIPAGATIAGVNPPKMEDLLEVGKNIADNINATLADIRILAKSANSVVVDNRGKLDSAISNLDVTAKNFAEFSDDLKKHPWKLLSKGK